MKLQKKLFTTKSNKKDKDKIEFKLPLVEIEDIIVAKDNKYKMVAKVTPINGELLDDESLDAVAIAIQSALNSFEGRQGIYIQSERVDISNNINSIEKRKEQLQDEFKIEELEYQKEYLKSIASESRTILNFYIALELREKNKKTAIQVLEDAFVSIKNELESQDMYVMQLKKNEIMQVLYEKMNPEQSQVEKIQSDWNVENIIPQSATIFKDGRHIEIENRLYRFFAISKYPKTVNKYRWLKKLLTIKGDVNIAIILSPKNKTTIIKELSKAIDETQAKVITAKDEGTRQEYESQVVSAKSMIEELGGDNVNLYDTNITIGISAINLEELDTLSNIVRSKISSAYLQSTEIKRKEFQPFYTILPILADNMITQNYVWNLSTKDIASIIPFDSSEFMENEGTLIGKNEVSRGLVITNYRNRQYNNSHMCVVADSGSGKTFFLKTDVIRNLPYTDYTIMFDIKGDLKFPFGKRYTFSATSGIIINPFHIRNAIGDGEGESVAEVSNNIGIYLSQKIMDLIVFFKWIIPNMTPYDESILEEDIRDCYKKCNLDFNSEELPKEFCTMEDLYNIIEEKIKYAETDMEKERRNYLKACLRPYAKGTYAAIFNGQTNWDFNFFTVFDISNIPEVVKKPLYDILLKDTWQFSKKDGTINPTIKDIYVDECHEFADPQNPQTLMFLSTKLSKQGRGFGVRLVTATQNLPDFLSIPRFGQAIIDNSYFKLFMRLGESDIPVAKKLYSFSNNEIKVLRGSGNKKKGSKGKGIFIVGTQRTVIQTRASKHELEIIDPVQFEEIYGRKSRYYGGVANG